MNMTHTNGRHAYKGILNSRSQRNRSKIYKGLNINLWKVNKAFRKLDADRQKQIHKSKTKIKNNI